MERFYAYWGKAGDGEGEFHRLVYHCLDVAAVGSVLARLRPKWVDALARIANVERPGIESVLSYLLLLHDLGKFGAGFQAQREDLVRKLGRTPQNVANSPRHDTLGFLLWQEMLDPSSPAHRRDLLLALEAPEELSDRRRQHLLTPWMAAVLGHHGRPPEVRNASLSDHFGTRRPVGPWTDVAAFSEAAMQLLQPAPVRLRSVERAAEAFKASSWWLAGFVILCDWVASNRAWFEFEPRELALADYWDRACVQAENAVWQAGLEPRRARSFAGFRQTFDCDPSPLQQRAAEIPLADGPQLYLIEDLTGGGKTEAALTLVSRLLEAGRADGLYFALPTMATANAMYGRVDKVRGKLFQDEPPVSFVLAHSGPNLAGSGKGIDGGGLEGQPREASDAGENSSAAARSWLADGRKRALLADVGVGTIDQALVAAVRSRHNSLRLLGLHGHVLVVDEVHACDEYMNGILEELLLVQAAMGGSAVLLSATLPLKMRERLVNAFRKGLGMGEVELGDRSYPSLVQVAGGHPVVAAVEPRAAVARTVGIEFFSSSEEAAAWCLRQAEEGKCVAWIRNTVRDAIEAYDGLVAKVGAERVQLFHARFPMADRLATEQDVVARFGVGTTEEQRAGRIVVATQVMEQSLDVDFDEMVSDLAPIDRLIQRCGRLQRHARTGRRAPPVLRVLAPQWQAEPGKDWPGKEFAGTLAVYERPSALWRTQRCLREEGKLELPGRARALVESVFGEDETVAESLQLDNRELKSEGTQLQKRSMANFNRISLEQGYQRSGPEWADDERAPTRLGEPTNIIRLVRSRGGLLDPWSQDESLPMATRWRLGEVSVRASQVASGADDVELRAQLAKLGAEPPEHIIPIDMEICGSEWRGRAWRPGRGGREEPVTVVFSPGRGLSFVREREE